MRAGWSGVDQDRRTTAQGSQEGMSENLKHHLPGPRPSCLCDFGKFPFLLVKVRSQDIYLPEDTQTE